VATTPTEAQRSVEAVWRIESARLVANLVRFTGDVGAAEDLAHDALVAALEQWPKTGVPDRPGAWLLVVARRRGIDAVRRQASLEAKRAGLGHELALGAGADEVDVDAMDDDIGDEVLRLVFVACHPVLSTEARVALTLRLIGGLSTGEVARAFLVPEPTVAQRIVRAKRTLTEARVPFEVPGGAERMERLASVLEVIYLIFNEGYAATSGGAWTRPALCEEALRLGRILAGLLPEEPEVHGLAALMEFQASRLRTRLDANGAPVLLADQDRSRWDRLLIGRGVVALGRAEACGRAFGPYALQAAIAACHARAARSEDTDWVRIVALYDALVEVAPTPVVALNRAVALAMAFGPEAGLEAVEVLAGEPALARYHLLPSVRGDLLARLGRADEARAEFERAATLTANEAERSFLLERAAATGCFEGPSSGRR